MNLDIWNNMDEFGGHDTKQNNPDKDKQILYSITYVESKKSDSYKK